jgi:hypothetical protein
MFLQKNNFNLCIFLIWKKLFCYGQMCNRKSSIKIGSNFILCIFKFKCGNEFLSVNFPRKSLTEE